MVTAAGHDVEIVPEDRASTTVWILTADGDVYDIDLLEFKEDGVNVFLGGSCRETVAFGTLRR